MSLNRKHYLRYYNDMDFRNLIHSKLTNPRLHLGLVLYNYKQITDAGLKHLANVKKLKFRSPIEYLLYIHLLNLNL